MTLVKKIFLFLIYPMLSFLYSFIIWINNLKKVKTEKKYYSSICAIFKNEGPYLKEWIEYYKLIGIQHIYLYNNFSSDNYLEILAPYIKSGYVTLTEWAYEQGQMSAYIHCVENFSSDCNWIGFIDLDEFIYGKNIFDFNKFLHSIEKYPVLHLNWRSYGSSNLTKRNMDCLVIEDFIYSTDFFEKGKCFFNTNFKFDSNYKKNQYFHHYCWIPIGNIYVSPINVNKKFYIYPISDVFLNKSKNLNFWINHYAIKSLEEYKNRLSKGDVFYTYNPRTLETFYKLDKKCTTINKVDKRIIEELKRKL